MESYGYRRIRVVGKGAFGTAILCETRDGKRYVVKEVSFGSMSRGEQDACMNEISVLRRLNSPNIVKYVDHFQTRDTLYIVMEYADSGDLSALLARYKSRGGLPEDQIMHYFVQICFALKHLHSRNILHRDLKSQNVFLSQNRKLVKLGDFGISTVLRNSVALAQTRCGTPYYFSPELCEGRPYNSKSDIWSLGCLLYEMCVGSPPFKGQGMRDLMQAICSAGYKPLPKTFSRDTRYLVATMLQRDPASRPSVQQILKLPCIHARMEQICGTFRPPAPAPAERPKGRDNNNNNQNNNNNNARNNNKPAAAQPLPPPAGPSGAPVVPEGRPKPLPQFANPGGAMNLDLNRHLDILQENIRVMHEKDGMRRREMEAREKEKEREREREKRERERERERERDQRELRELRELREQREQREQREREREREQRGEERRGSRDPPPPTRGRGYVNNNKEEKAKDREQNGRKRYDRAFSVPADENRGGGQRRSNSVDSVKPSDRKREEAGDRKEEEEFALMVTQMTAELTRKPRKANKDPARGDRGDNNSNNNNNNNIAGENNPRPPPPAADRDRDRRPDSRPKDRDPRPKDREGRKEKVEGNNVPPRWLERRPSRVTPYTPPEEARSDVATGCNAYGLPNRAKCEA